MKILFLISRKEKPSSRLRIVAFQKALNEESFDTTIYECNVSFFKRLKKLISLSNYDVVVVQKKLFCAFEVALIRRLSKVLLFDYDDAILFNDHGKVKVRDARRFGYITKCADGLICGNNYLLELASNFKGPHLVLPTPLKLLDYPYEEKTIEESRPIRIGWVGTEATQKYFLEKETLWKRLAEKFSLEFVMISSKAPESELEISFLPWSQEEEGTLIASLDLGVMPLPDNAFTKGKCSYKILQYQACGVIPVASKVGYNLEVISHGETGFFAETYEDWCQVLKQVSNDQEIIHRMREQARRQIEENYSLQNAVKQWIQFVKGFGKDE